MQIEECSRSVNCLDRFILITERGRGEKRRWDFG